MFLLFFVIDYQTIDEVNQQTIYNEHNDNEILFSISGFRPNQTKTILYHILSLIFLGIPYVIFHSFPKLKASFLSKSPLRDAQLLLGKEPSLNTSKKLTFFTF